MLGGPSVPSCAPPASARSIAGGFVPIPVPTLLRAWHACRDRPLGAPDFRAYLACREIVARRCRLDEGRAPAYAFAELAALLGVSTRRARAAVDRLVAAGLLEWSAAAVAFPDPPEGPGPAADDPLADTIGSGRGDLAVPRRLLRALADGARPSLIAAALGVLLRCLSRRRGGFDGRGRLKASWVARAFAVDPRAVKAARRELVELGWIAPEPSAQHLENRWGRAYRIDLTWAPPGGGTTRRESPPPPAPACRVSPPPLPDPDPLRGGEKDQEPAPGGPAGVESGEGGGEGEPGSAPIAAIAPAPTPPEPDPRPPAPAAAARLGDVRTDDLRDTGRVLELHRQAAARGWVSGSEADRLRVVGAAEHALAVGRGNPPGLFVHLVRGGLWRYLTQGDEGRANARIKRELRGGLAAGAVATATGGVGRGPALSSDAATVREVRAAAIRAGIYRDPFPALRSAYPDWTRERWDRACGEASGSGGAWR